MITTTIFETLSLEDISSMFLGYLTLKFTHTLFTKKNTLLTSNNAIFNTITHTPFFTHFNKKKPLKIGIQGNNLHIFL